MKQDPKDSSEHIFRSNSRRRRGLWGNGGNRRRGSFTQKVKDVCERVWERVGKRGWVLVGIAGLLMIVGGGLVFFSGSKGEETAKTEPIADRAPEWDGRSETDPSLKHIRGRSAAGKNVANGRGEAVTGEGGEAGDQGEPSAPSGDVAGEAGAGEDSLADAGENGLKRSVDGGREEGKEAKVPKTALTGAFLPNGVPQSFEMTVGSALPEVDVLVLSGFHDILLFEPERATQSFLRAVALDPGCVLAHFGVLWTCGHRPSPYPEEAADSLAFLEKAMTSETLPVRDRIYAQTAVDYVKLGLPAAQKHLGRIVRTWRGDLWARLTNALLLCDGYLPDSGEPRTGTLAALERVDKVLETNPDNAAALGVRALIEHDAPQPTGRALACAERAVALAPEHPTGYQVLGHFLFRAGRYPEAVGAFEHAAVLYDKYRHPLNVSLAHDEGWLRARAYGIVAHFCAGNPAEAFGAAQTLALLPVENPFAPSPKPARGVLEPLPGTPDSSVDDDEVVQEAQGHGGRNTRESKGEMSSEGVASSPVSGNLSGVASEDLSGDSPTNSVAASPLAGALAEPGATLFLPDSPDLPAPLPSSLPATGTLLQLWDIKTLPARLALGYNTLSALQKAKSTLKDDAKVNIDDVTLSPDVLYRRALLEYLNTRELALQTPTGDKVLAAEKVFHQWKERLTAARAQASAHGATSPWARAYLLLELLDLDLKARLYPDSRERWRQNAESLQSTAALLLPPALPFPIELLDARETFDERGALLKSSAKSSTKSPVKAPANASPNDDPNTSAHTSPSIPSNASVNASPSGDAKEEDRVTVLIGQGLRRFPNHADLLALQSVLPDGKLPPAPDLQSLKGDSARSSGSTSSSSSAKKPSTSTKPTSSSRSGSSRSSSKSSSKPSSGSSSSGKKSSSRSKR